MIYLRILTSLALVLFLAGVIVGALVRRVPMRGWIAVSLLLFSALLWTLSEPSDSSAPERVWTLPCFSFVAPIAVIYSFRIRRHAPDRIFATAALVGACIIAIALIFTLCSAAYVLYLTFFAAS